MTNYATRTVLNPRWSSCGSAKLSQLNPDEWWTDTSFQRFYLHFKGKDGETAHRVFCRGCKEPRLCMAKGRLMWLVPRKR